MRQLGLLSDENIPQGVNVISAKWVYAWKTDSNGSSLRQKLGWSRVSLGNTKACVTSRLLHRP